MHWGKKHVTHKIFILFTFLSLHIQALPQNPALLPTQNETWLQFETRSQGIQYNGIPTDASSSATLWGFNFQYPFSLKRFWDRRAGLELSLSGPYGKLRSLRAYDPLDHYSLRYGHSDSQFQANAGIGLELFPDSLYFGTGIHFYLSGAGNSEATLSTVNPTGRLALDVGLNSSLYSGFFYRRERTSISLLYRQEMDPEFVQKFDAKAPIGGENTFHQPLTVKSHLYFEPHVLDLNTRYDSGPVAVGLGVSYEIWSRYQHPVVMAETIDSNGKITSTTPPDSVMRDTWNPHLQLEIPFSKSLHSSIGYIYRPTAVLDSSGVGNPIDTNTHVVMLGLRHSVKGTELPTFPLSWGLYAEGHFFEARTVTKTADPSKSYTFGGRAYSLSGFIGIQL